MNDNQTQKKANVPTKGNVPTLRFPEFSGEWKRKTLGEVIKIQGGYAFKSEDFQDSGIPIVRISNLPQDDDSVSLVDCVYYEQGSYENYEIHLETYLLRCLAQRPGRQQFIETKRRPI